MKKLCQKCNHINEYEADVCAKCGCDLNHSEKYKMCPKCGDVFPLLKDECPRCRETLVVRGRPAAMVFDEKAEPDVISTGSKVFAFLVPLLGFLYAIVLSIKLQKEKKLTAAAAFGFCVSALFIHTILIFAVYFVGAILF